MVFLDEGPLKQAFLTWLTTKKQRHNIIHIGCAYPPMLKLYHPLFFENCDFYNYTWKIIEHALPFFWRKFTDILDYIMLAYGFKTLEMWKEYNYDNCGDDNGSLSINYFAFSNESLLEEAMNTDEGAKLYNDDIFMNKILNYIVYNIFKSPEHLIINILSNCASNILSVGSVNLSFLIPNLQKPSSIGIFNPVKATPSSSLTIFNNTLFLQTICEDALKLIPKTLFDLINGSDDKYIKMAIKTIIKNKPEIMLYEKSITPNNVQLEIFARALALSAINASSEGAGQETKYRKFLLSLDDDDVPTSFFYKVINSFNYIKYDWPIYTNNFNCMAHNISADSLRRYRSIIMEKLINRRLSAIKPWNENTIFKVCIAAVWYVIIFQEKITIEGAYESVFKTFL